MRLPQTKLQRVKAIVHFTQAFLIFIAGCLTLAVMTKDGGFGGQTGFYFALCFFTIPALIYQALVPMWSRTYRLNSPWAIATIDILFTILWFAAAIAVAVWNANGIAKGKDSSSDDNNNSNENAKRDDNKKKDGTCASFGYGSEKKCEVSKASVGFGIIICLLFAVTSYISVRAVIEYRRTGVVPNANAKNHGNERLDGDDPSKDVWSANTDELNHNHDDDRLAFGQNMEDDREGLLNRDSFDTQQPADGMHPGRRLSYQSPSQQVAAPPSYDDNIAPSALSPTGLPMSPNGRVQFPEANYNALR